MATDAFFPVNFLAVRKARRPATAAGVYLRWFVKPYLGLPGIAPLHISGSYGSELPSSGFRLFRHRSRSTVPPTRKLNVVDLMPDEQQILFSEIVSRQGWKAVMAKGGGDTKIDIGLRDKFKHTVCYVRFDYSLCSRQTLRLTYKIHNAATQTDTQKQVAVHYEDLAQRLGPGEEEQLTYALHVESADESITEISLASNRPIVLGSFDFVLNNHLPFFRWSAPGGDAVWEELTPDMFLVRALNDVPIKPGKYSRLVDSMELFYDRYHSVVPDSRDGDRSIAFLFPELAGFNLDRPIAREYIADQYEQLCNGAYDPGPQAASRFHISPQDAASLASLDPAIAYLLGVFRVLRLDADGMRKSVYKLQGTWPAGRRFCIYRPYNPALRLAPPKMHSIKAAPSGSTRVLRDYTTSRTHHHIRFADLSWKQAAAGASGQRVWLGPAAYLVLRSRQEASVPSCKSAFYIPQDRETDPSTGETHYHDWYDFYRGTDIAKVLDGKYTYQIACHDIFGQLSGFRAAATDVDPRKLGPAELQKPEISISRLPDPGDPNTLRTLDIPLEVVQSSTGFLLRGFNRDHMKLDYSFFWPLESSYVWDKNRATGKPSLDHFKLLYLADTPLFANVKLTIEENKSDGVTVKLVGIGKAVGANVPANNSLYSLLKKLRAVNSSGMITAAKAQAALVGGTLVFRQEWQIVEAEVKSSTQEITLRLLPAADPERQQLKDGGSYYPNVYIRNNRPHGAKLFWNTDAVYGGSRIGWNPLGDPTHEIKPAPHVSYSGKLVSESTMPQGVVQTPSDLVPSHGLVSIKLPDPGVASSGGSGESVNNHFIIRLPKGHKLPNSNRLQIVPIAGGTTLKPGEYPKPQPPDAAGIDYPDSVSTLFSEDRIVSFYAARIADDPSHPGKAIFRGDPLPFTSNDANKPGEYLVYPNKNHKNWLVIVPTVVKNKELPLKYFLENNEFNEDQYLSSTVSFATLAVVTGEDKEVTDTLQKTVATKKLAFVRYLPPPVINVPAQPQPSFGIAASPPDYNGESLIRVKRIYGGYDLSNRLSGNHQYVLYGLPADRAVGGVVPVKYAKDPASGGIYRRNMVDIKTVLNAYSSTDPLAAEALQKLYADFAQRVNDEPLTKEELLDYAVELSGESRAVFLYAIKACDATAAKESTEFVALSPPIYVEDPSVPEAPQVRLADFILRRETPPGGSGVQDFFLELEVKAARSLDSVPFGYASESELNASLLGAEFRHVVKQYRLYLTTGRAGQGATKEFDEELLACPDDSDFVKITGPGLAIGDPAVFDSFDEISLSIMIPAELTTISAVPGDPGSVIVKAKVKFAAGVQTSEIPSRVYTCLRAENYLGRFSPLDLTPGVLREIL